MSAIFENWPIMSFFAVLLILAAGDLISALTKAFVPSVFVSAVLFVLGFWYGWFPLDIVNKAGLGMPIASVFMYIIIVHMGTLMSLRDMLAEWKTIVIAAAGLVGMSILLLTVGRLIVGHEAVVIGTPPLAGGIVAALMMSEAAAKMGLSDLSVLATVIFVVQGFVGYPITAICLKMEGKRLLDIRKNDPEKLANITKASSASAGRGLLPPIPYKCQTPFIYLVTIAFVAIISDLAAIQLKTYLSGINPEYARYSLHPLVICLIFGAIAAELGIVERKPLVKAESLGFLLTGLMAFVLSTLNKATPEMMMTILKPLIVIIAVGVTGLLIGAVLLGRLLGYTSPMAMALSLTALYGFPSNYILTNEASKALAADKEEFEFLMSQMLPKMLVGGFITVTITSVIMAGVFLNLL